MKRPIREWIGLSLLPPLGLFLLIVALWQAGTAVYDVPRYLLPSPRQVREAAWEHHERLWQAFWLTGLEALCGFGLSFVLGTLIAFAFSQSRIIRNSCYPYAIFLQTVPVVAIAPLIINWLGTGFQSVAVVAFIVSLFPIITNATSGLISVDPDLLDFFRLHDTSRWQVLLKLRLPNAVPNLITGAKTSSGLAVIGAIVGEFFAGYGIDHFGLGYLIMQTSLQLKTDQLFASVIASTLLGMMIFGTVSWIGATILSRWYDVAEDSSP